MVQVKLLFVLSPVPTPAPANDCALYSTLVQNDAHLSKSTSTRTRTGT